MERDMALHSHEPKFGNWENKVNVPYSMYFANARKGKIGAKMSNPNNPQENPEVCSKYEAKIPASPSKIKVEPEKSLGQQAVITTYEKEGCKEDGIHRHFRFKVAPARQADMLRRSVTVPAHHRAGLITGETYWKPVRNNVDSENSIEPSPLHNQTRTPGRGGVDSASPSLDGKSSRWKSHCTPGRCRKRSTKRGYESPDGGVAVPKFGDWDEKDPSSGDRFTRIFNKVREERNRPETLMGSLSPPRNHNSQTKNDCVKCFCFSRSK